MTEMKTNKIILISLIKYRFLATLNFCCILTWRLKLKIPQEFWLFGKFSFAHFATMKMDKELVLKSESSPRERKKHRLCREDKTCYLRFYVKSVRLKLTLPYNTNTKPNNQNHGERWRWSQSTVDRSRRSRVLKLIGHVDPGCYSW